MADLSNEKEILFLSHFRIVEYSMSLFSAIIDVRRLKVTSAALESPPDVENTRGVKEPCSTSLTLCS